MPPKLLYRHCPKCRVGFSTFEESKVYCGDDCEFRHRAMKKQSDLLLNENVLGAVKCRGCDIYFMPRPNQIYCHLYCHKATHNARNRQKTVEKNKNNPVDKICPVCNFSFTNPSTRIKYCGKICAEKHNKERLKKINAQKKEENAKSGKKRRKMPYHVLNALAEKKRLDEDWNRLTH